VNSSAAADEVDDFIAVVRLDLRSEPLITGENVEITFNGHAAVIETEFAQEVGDGSAGFGGVRFAVDRDG